MNMTDICLLMISISQLLLIVPPIISFIIKSMKSRRKQKRYKQEIEKKLIENDDNQI